MAAVDWLLLGLYLLLTFLLGLWLARRNRGQEDYFVAGRRLNGWLAGASMAATTFSIDTPLYIAGLVGSRGLAGNWEWWSFGLAHVAMAVVFVYVPLVLISSDRSSHPLRRHRLHTHLPQSKSPPQRH